MLKSNLSLQYLTIILAEAIVSSFVHTEGSIIRAKPKMKCLLRLSNNMCGCMYKNNHEKTKKRYFKYEMIIYWAKISFSFASPPPTHSLTSHQSSSSSSNPSGRASALNTIYLVFCSSVSRLRDNQRTWCTWNNCYHTGVS